MRTIFPILFLLLLFCGEAYSSSQCSDTTVRIMTWNLLNFPSQGNLVSDTTTRLPCYRTAIQFVNPDILVTQENSGSNSISIFLQSVLNTNGPQYSAGTFINGYDTDNGIFYRTGCFRFISNTPIETALRDVNIFTLVHISTNDTIKILSCHLKATSGVVNEALRAAEVDSIRKVTNTFINGTDFMICGDFNIYGSYEVAYQRLLQDDSATDGNFVDPLSMTGIWNNPAYSSYHTQSPRTRSFGGGATGGLDDRFDMMLFSTAIMQAGRITYMDGSVTPVGNDGLHYGDSINRPPNNAVPQNVADALHCAADHLPVYSDFDFSPSINVEEFVQENFQLRIFPNPTPGEVMLGFMLSKECMVEITIYDQLARVVKFFPNEITVPGICKRTIAQRDELLRGNYFVRVTTSRGAVVSSMFTVE
ncbi:MAG: hypothetical protein ABI763_07705 [Bacteroidota bacterium]